MSDPISGTPTTPPAPAVTPAPAPVLIEDGDEIREAPADARGYVEAIKKERAARREVTKRLNALEAQHAETAKAAAEAATLRQRLAEIEPHATAWQAHTAAEAKRIADANAARIATLTDAQRAVLEGLDAAKVAALLDAWAPAGAHTAADPAGAHTPKAVAYPAGGAAPTGVPSADELTPAERAWVESDRPDLRVANAAAVKAMFKKFGPK